MKTDFIWNFLGALCVISVVTWITSVEWKRSAPPLEHLLAAVLTLLVGVIAFYLGAEDEED